MKKIFALLVLFLMSDFAEAQVANIKAFKGAWKEVSRLRNDKKIPFRDTLFFEIVSSNLCIWGKSSPTAPRVRLKQIGSSLFFGAEEYDLLSFQDNTMRLSGDEGLEIEMIRFDNKPPTKQPKQPKQVALRNTNHLKFKPAASVKMGTVPPKIEPFVGSWKCYKRTSIKPLQNELKYRLLRLVEIEETSESITAKLYGFEDLEGKPSWVVQNYEGGILYSSGKDDRAFKVINCQENELIIENEGVTYYMNKLKK